MMHRECQVAACRLSPRPAPWGHGLLSRDAGKSPIIQSSQEPHLLQAGECSAGYIGMRLRGRVAAPPARPRNPSRKRAASCQALQHRNPYAEEPACRVRRAYARHIALPHLVHAVRGCGLRDEFVGTHNLSHLPSQRKIEKFSEIPVAAFLFREGAPGNRADTSFPPRKPFPFPSAGAGHPPFCTVRTRVRVRCHQPYHRQLVRGTGPGWTYFTRSFWFPHPILHGSLGGINRDSALCPLSTESTEPTQSTKSNPLEASEWPRGEPDCVESVDCVDSVERPPFGAVCPRSPAAHRLAACAPRMPRAGGTTGRQDDTTTRKPPLSPQSATGDDFWSSRQPVVSKPVCGRSRKTHHIAARRFFRNHCASRA